MSNPEAPQHPIWHYDTLCLTLIRSSKILLESHVIFASWFQNEEIANFTDRTHALSLTINKRTNTITKINLNGELLDIPKTTVFMYPVTGMHGYEAGSLTALHRFRCPR